MTQNLILFVALHRFHPIEASMAIKRDEVYAYEHTPHPIEYQMYYSC